MSASGRTPKQAHMTVIPKTRAAQAQPAPEPQADAKEVPIVAHPPRQRLLVRRAEVAAGTGRSTPGSIRDRRNRPDHKRRTAMNVLRTYLTKLVLALAIVLAGAGIAYN